MKKLFFLSSFAALLLSAAFIYSCQKEKPVTALSTETTVEGQAVATDRNGVCSTITVGMAAGLFICGTDSGNSQCTTCGQDKMGEIIASNAEVYGFTGSNSFTITNITGAAVRVAIAFNCTSQSPQWYNIPAGGSISLTTNVVNGCCVAVPC